MTGTKIKNIALTFFLTIHLVVPSVAQQLWYDRPAKAWEEALPLGNGETGGMVFGGISKERVQFNDITLWSGYPKNGNNPEAANLLNQLRSEVFNRDYTAAEQTWSKMQGPFSANYLPMGDLWLDFDLDDSKVSGYKRLLDLTKAQTITSFRYEGVNFTRTTYISHPDKVLVMTIKADKNGRINLKAKLTSQLQSNSIVFGDILSLNGLAPDAVTGQLNYPKTYVYNETTGMNFNVQVKFKLTGGKFKTSGKEVIIENADAVTLFLSEATSFNGFDRMPSNEGLDARAIASTKLDKAIEKGDSALYRDHLIDYQRLYNRVTFRLKSPKFSQLPTDVRLKRFDVDASDLDFQTLFFQYGRYLMISSSREGGQATNLQGLWNDKLWPAWRSNYTININTQMNYWPAENLNLSECHQPLFDFIKRLAINGAKTAAVNYGIRTGWVAHHNSDIWAMTNPVGAKNTLPGAFCWQMGGAWLSTHLWEHYAYTCDREFLKEHGYPLMKGAAQFILKWLVKDPSTKYLVTAPSTSPENNFIVNNEKHFITRGSTMDMSIIRELFKDVVAASLELGVDKEFREQILAAGSNLAPIRVGRYGQIQEWLDDVDDPNDTHRHISQLFGLFPGSQISLEGTPKIAKAAETTMIHRGDFSTGWSMAWKINWWARLRNGDHAYSILRKAFNFMDPDNKSAKEMGGGGTYPNLFDAHPPFQIDANFGAAAGIAEMLVQSHQGYIDLLPALPNDWKEGSISGIKARGNFELKINWIDGKLRSATVKSIVGGPCKVRSAGSIKILGTKFWSSKNGNIATFQTLAGKTYTILPK